MRPKKRVMLYSADEEWISLYRLPLWCAGFAVEACASPDRIAGSGAPDVLVIFSGGEPIGAVLRAALTLRERPRVLVLKPAAEVLGADRTLEREAGMALVIAAVRQLAARKRGPRKQASSVPEAERTA